MSDPDPHLVPPTLTDFERFSKGADEIQAKCACRRWDPRECWAARYPRSTPDDLDWAGDDECECHCHDELRQLEEDIWGRDDDYP
jgi:hypothetical protein